MLPVVQELAHKYRLFSAYFEPKDEKCPLPLTLPDLRITFQATASNIGELIPLNLRSQYKLLDTVPTTPVGTIHVKRKSCHIMLHPWWADGWAVPAVWAALQAPPGTSVPDPWHFGVDPDPRIRTNGSGSFHFHHWPSRCQQKTNKKKFFCIVLFEGTVLLHNFSKIKNQKEVTKL